MVIFRNDIPTVNGKPMVVGNEKTFYLCFTGLVWGKIYRKTPYLMVKTMVSCGFSLKPIQWLLEIHGNPLWSLPWIDVFCSWHTWTHEDHFLVWRYGSGWQTGQSKHHRLQPLLHLIFISILSMATWIVEIARVGCLQKWRGNPKSWPCLMGKALGKWGVHPLQSGCAIFFQTI